MSEEKTMKKSGILAITMGDPSGIGPEIIVKALSKPGVKKSGSFLVVGSLPVFKETEKKLRVSLDLEVLDFTRPGKDLRTLMNAKKGGTILVDPCNLNRKLLRKKEPSKEGGRVSLACIETGIRLALSRVVDGLVTAPVSKEALALAGTRDLGHTEILARRTKTPHPVMMFAGPGLRIALVTTHLPLRRIARCLTQEKILHTLEVTSRALFRQFGIKNPLLGVLSLNPHGGERGLFGREEEEMIIPAMKDAGRKGIRCDGPLPPDTAFLPAVRKRIDGYVAMYHDQALPAVKILLFGKSVNITLGIPFIRTSVDHGTAFPLAGRGEADPGSLIQAIRMARRLTGRTGEKR